MNKNRYRLFNGTSTQIKHWSDTIIDPYSFELKGDLLWGKSGDNNINRKYNEIKKMVVDSIDNSTTLLELGSYDGAWTQHFLLAEKIICVDVMEESYELIKKRCGSVNVSFYKTQGNELHGIKSNSVNVIFSVDSLMRIEKSDIELYFSEFSRVLNHNGKAIIHLPCISKRGCQLSLFTYLTPNYINKLAKINFKHFHIHKNMIRHGIILEGFAE